MNGTARRLLADHSEHDAVRRPVPIFRPRTQDAGPPFSLAELLGSGGDSRLDLDPATGLNRYGCSLLPRPTVASFSASTASSISRRALARVGDALASYERTTWTRGVWGALDFHLEGLREAICDHLGLCVSDVDVVFAASGTDAQIQALASVRARFGASLVSIVVGADETGSGTAFTAEGRHFGERTAHGRTIVKGARIEGFEGIDDAIAIPARGPEGPRSMAEIDAAVLAAVEAARRGGRSVLLQAMDCSKLGGRYPSDACLDFIRERWRGSVQIVLDACQMRLGRGRLQRHLEQGDMVLLTGSKFFTGPSFSGALLIPTWSNAAAAGEAILPKGLCDYASRQDWPSRLPATRAALPSRVTLGPWLRWEAAVAEMEDYFAVPAAFRQQALRLFQSAACELARSGSRRPVISAERPTAEAADEEFATPTIFPFTIGRESQPIAIEQAAKLYADLNRDVSHALPPSSGEEAIGLASRAFHIGQPVRLNVDGHETAVLRVAADSRFVVDCWSADPLQSRQRIDAHLSNLRLVFEKLELLHAGGEAALAPHASQKAR